MMTFCERTKAKALTMIILFRFRMYLDQKLLIETDLAIRNSKKHYLKVNLMKSRKLSEKCFPTIEKNREEKLTPPQVFLGAQALSMRKYKMIL